MIKKLGRYEILGILGRGSMGVVYKGIDPQINKLVAIKTMNPKVLQQEDMQQRFYREGTILGRLQHPNIIHIYHVGADGDTCYIAMEYLDGISLDRVLERKEKLSLDRVLHIICQVCEGLNEAHRQSVTHRDIKPANIFLQENDHVKVLDFGVAHFQNSQLTNSGMLLGTINYIAPEQITGLRVDYRADIFSVGVILYEMITGLNPFLGDNISKTMMNIVDNDAPTPTDIPSNLCDIMEKALHKDRDKRYASAEILAHELELVRNELKGDTASVEIARDKLRKEMAKRYVAQIGDHLQKEKLQDAERILDQLRDLNPAHTKIEKMRHKLERAHHKKDQKKQFAEKVNQKTLLRANEYLADRHFVLAVEYCDKVLRVDPDNQDARVMRANSLHKLKLFLEESERESK